MDLSSECPIDLRTYQSIAIDDCREALQRVMRLILKAPTGSGKTEIAMAITHMALSRQKRVAFMVNRVGLLEQTSRRFLKAKLPHGIIQSDNTRNIELPVVVCSIQTVARRGLPPVDLIIIDEGHGVAGSKDYLKLLFAHNQIPVIALTATPYSRGLAKPYPELGGPLFEELIQVSSISQLIEDGFLVDCEIYAPDEPDLTGVRTQRNQFGEIDYSEADLAVAVDKPNLIGAIVEHWKRLGRDKPTVCFATNIKHSQHIVQEFISAGIPAVHIDCYMRGEDKQEALEAFKFGEYKILCNVALVAEGFDHPETEVMILARPTKSLIRYLQMAGRILRPFDGKYMGLILDHSGSTAKLGYPTEDRDIPLDDGSPKHSSPKRTEEPLPKKCPRCSFMKPAKVHVCPKCGFAPEKQHGVLVDETQKLVKRQRQTGSQEKQEFYSQLLYIQQQKGYQPGWVAHTFHDYFGVWPKDMAPILVPPSQATKNWLTYRAIRRSYGRTA